MIVLTKPSEARERLDRPSYEGLAVFVGVDWSGGPAARAAGEVVETGESPSLMSEWIEKPGRWLEWVRALVRRFRISRMEEDGRAFGSRSWRC